MDTQQSVFESSYGKYIGRVKWFKSKLGYGFITVKEDTEETDVFIHQSNIKTKMSNYRTLREGEYVSLDISESDNTRQAVNVSGVYGGNLMCDNRIVSRTYGELEEDSNDGRETHNSTADNNH